jgi:pilus assembly protein CpaF
MEIVVNEILNHLREKNSSFERSDLDSFIQANLNLTDQQKLRLTDEFCDWGPLKDLIEDRTVSEILVNGPKSIWFERHGRLYAFDDHFLSDITFNNFLDRLCHKAGVQINAERPTTNGHIDNFRLHLVGPELTHGQPALSLRRQSSAAWDLSALRQMNFFSLEQQQQVERIIESHESFIVVGPTGSGKTTFLNACLKGVKPDERCVLIEDTEELHLPNNLCTRLLTRVDMHGTLPTIDQTELVKQCLRMRPDRLIIGEVRSAEAKDLLLALSTGHNGSMGTLHASSAQQALFRLEMLVQMGAPFWTAQIIRRLIGLSLKYIFVAEKTQDGQRRLEGIYMISGFEDMGLLLEKVL